MHKVRPYVARLAPLLPQLAFAYRRRSGDIPEVLRQAGRYGERHIGVLVSLALAGPATVGEIAERMLISGAHASLVVGELARAGLVEREHDERDRRRIVVSLSESVRPAIAEMRSRHAVPLIRFLSELDEEDADRFIAHLATLVAYLREEEPVRSRTGPGAHGRLSAGSPRDAPGGRLIAEQVDQRNQRHPRPEEPDGGQRA